MASYPTIRKAGNNNGEGEAIVPLKVQTISEMGQILNMIKVFINTVGYV